METAGATLLLSLLNLASSAFAATLLAVGLDSRDVGVSLSELMQTLTDTQRVRAARAMRYFVAALEERLGGHLHDADAHNVHMCVQSRASANRPLLLAMSHE